MIVSFRDKWTERLYAGDYVKKFDAFAQQARRRLRVLDAAVTLHDLQRLPSNCLELLEGDRSGSHSIRINRRWRICFFWRDQRAYDVEIVDYH